MVENLEGFGAPSGGLDAAAAACPSSLPLKLKFYLLDCCSAAATTAAAAATSAAAAAAAAAAVSGSLLRRQGGPHLSPASDG
ncbi:hypothetical protein ACSSS7_003392 [Eimeria intestinalis]